MNHNPYRKLIVLDPFTTIIIIIIIVIDYVGDFVCLFWKQHAKFSEREC